MSQSHSNDDERSLWELPSVFRNAPATRTAQENIGVLLRASREAGYSVIGRRCGHDKSWVSRWLSGENKADIGEVLHWLDECGLKITYELDSVEQLIALAESIERDLQEIEKTGTLTDPVQSSLVRLASLGLQSIAERE